MKRLIATTMFLTGFVATVAQAQEPAAPTPALAATPLSAPGSYPDEYIQRPLTLNAGMAEVYVPVTINLSSGSVTKPIMIGPEIGYGVDDKLELRLVHDHGFCFNSCDKVYNDVGAMARYFLQHEGQMDVAVQGGLIFKSLDPAALALRVGAIFKYLSAPVAVYISPTVDFGMTKRSSGNKEFINVPVKVVFQSDRQLAPFFLTGIYGSVDGFGDTYGIPLGVGANFVVQHGFDVGGAFQFPRIAGGTGGGIDARELIVYAAWRNR
jgi:hypothetical protein